VFCLLPGFTLWCIGEQDWFDHMKQDSRVALASSKIQESKIQNLYYKQDSRISIFLDLAAKEIEIYINIQVIIAFTHYFKPCFTLKFCKNLSRVQLSKYLQARIKKDYQQKFLFKQESSKIVNFFLLHNK
jgi:hypothetical protein